MKRLIVILFILFFATSANASQLFHFYWKAPTGYTDGSQIINPNTEIGGYKLYISPISMGYQQPAFATIIGNIEFVDVQLPLGTWYVVLTAYTPFGVESDFSKELIVVSDTSPKINSIPMPPLLRLN